MNIDYKEECKYFDEFLKINNYEIKGDTGKERKICEMLSKIKISPIKKLSFNYKNIKKDFYNSIEVLGDDTKEFYKKIVPRITIKKIWSFENGYAEIGGYGLRQILYLTKKDFKNVDFIAYTHELGHVPNMRNCGKEEYVEYAEVLSIFFEYLSCLSLYGESALEQFLKIRLRISKDEARSYLSMDNEVSFKDEYHFKYLEQKKKDNWKYILSLEYALYLIELFRNDPITLKDVIDNKVCFCSSFREIEKELKYDISSCKKLIKISKGL